MNEYLSALVGGVLVGVSAFTLLFFSQRVAGISGIVWGLFRSADKAWRWQFVVGMLMGGVIFLPKLTIDVQHYESDPVLLVIAGLLVGVGAKLANGCTSGHGVCGVGRFSLRSLVATPVFMAAGMATVLVMSWLEVTG